MNTTWYILIKLNQSEITCVGVYVCANITTATSLDFMSDEKSLSSERGENIEAQVSLECYYNSFYCTVKSGKDEHDKK